MEPLEDPLTAHLLGWFQHLNARRTFTIIAGMGGGASIPDAVSYQELHHWAELTGNRPTPWEVEALTEMDKSWCAAYSAKGNGKAAAATERNQGVGEYCRGEKLEECQRNLPGAALEQACRTCPN